MPSRIYTRAGDTGETSLADGSRVPKDALRVAAYGTIDEANSWVGLARAEGGDTLLDQSLELLQHRIFNCSSNVAAPEGTGNPPGISPTDIALLEQGIDRFEAETGPVDRFILPGGSRCAALLHVARTVCRRAERTMVTLAEQEPVDAHVLKFINRASDFLFAAARYANKLEGVPDVEWNPNPPLVDE